ncbi:unnamed protein product, partial [Staurois parvus]
GAPQAIGDHGAPVSLPKFKKAYEKGTRGISWGPLLTPGPWAVPECCNGLSAPAAGISFVCCWGYCCWSESIVAGEIYCCLGGSIVVCCRGSISLLFLLSLTHSI